MKNTMKDIRGLIHIEEKGREIQFFFTEAALDIMKSRNVALDNEVAVEMKNAILSNDKIDYLLQPSRIVNFVNGIEKQVICEQFIQTNFPNLSILNHSISLYKKATISTTCVHCKELPCGQCLEDII